MPKMFSAAGSIYGSCEVTPFAAPSGYHHKQRAGDSELSRWRSARVGRSKITSPVSWPFG